MAEDGVNAGRGYSDSNSSRSSMQGNLAQDGEGEAGGGRSWMAATRHAKGWEWDEDGGVLRIRRFAERSLGRRRLGGGVLGLRPAGEVQQGTRNPGGARRTAA